MTRKGKTKGSRGPFEALRALKKTLEAEESRKAAGPGATERGQAKPPSTTPAPRPTSQDPVEGDDALLMARMFAGVTPLGSQRGRVPAGSTVEDRGHDRDRARRALELARIEDEAVHARLRTLVQEGVRFEVEDDGQHLQGRRVDVAPELLRKVRRGAFPIDGRLDMHGMIAPEARAQLELFLRTMRARGERCVLVIHGKGEHSPRGMGVLRGEIGAWLSQGPASEHVAAFATAPPEEGGSGAVCVLLRR